jgi:peptidyl-prolyl cis-trans isomerase C
VVNNPIRISLLVGAVVAVLLFPLDSFSQEETVLVRLGQVVITLQDFEEELREYGQSADFKNRLLTLSPQGKRKILKAMISERLMFKAALDEGTRLDQVEQRRLERMRRTFLARKYMQDRLAAEPLTEEALKQYWSSHQAEYTTPEQRKVRQVVVRTKVEAEEIRNLILKGTEIKTVAQERNVDASRKRGGDLGWIPKGIMVPEFDKVAFSLPEGELSPIFKTVFGYHLIVVEGIKPPVQRQLSEVREVVKRSLELETLEKLEEKLRQKYGLEIDEGLLEEALGKNSTRPKDKTKN